MDKTLMGQSIFVDQMSTNFIKVKIIVMETIKMCCHSVYVNAKYGHYYKNLNILYLLLLTEN